LACHVNAIKLLIFVADEENKQARVFVPGKPIQPVIIAYLTFQVLTSRVSWSPYPQIFARLQWDEHSSLFILSLIDEEKSFLRVGRFVSTLLHRQETAESSNRTKPILARKLGHKLTFRK
jgi:hypothetical protein